MSDVRCDATAAAAYLLCLLPLPLAADTCRPPPAPMTSLYSYAESTMQTCAYAHLRESHVEERRGRGRRI